MGSYTGAKHVTVLYAFDEAHMQAYATAAVELDRAQRGNPVAWMSPKKFYRTREMGLSNGEQLLEPLYTAQQPSQNLAPTGSNMPTKQANTPEVTSQGQVSEPSQPERKPIPDDELNDLAFQCGIQREDARDPGVEEFARAVEAFHGIKP